MTNKKYLTPASIFLFLFIFISFNNNLSAAEGGPCKDYGECDSFKYSLNDIIQHIKTWNHDIDNESIYFALDIITNSPERIIENQFGVKGIISLIGNYYMFAPEYSEYNGDYSGIPLILSNSFISLDTIQWPDRPSPNQFVHSDIDIKIENDYTKLLQKINFSDDGFWSNISNIRNQLLADVLIDKLNPEHRKILFFSDNKLNNK